mmetsp:Transcript_12203/g.32234  ORF Transcript_12203/g.32234 Transcript_12203/m.32234 type:complete len:211 (+) Transcript_12203:1209-1841(+)
MHLCGAPGADARDAHRARHAQRHDHRGPLRERQHAEPVRPGGNSREPRADPRRFRDGLVLAGEALPAALRRRLLPALGRDFGFRRRLGRLQSGRPGVRHRLPARQPGSLDRGDHVADEVPGAASQHPSRELGWAQRQRAHRTHMVVEPRVAGRRGVRRRGKAGRVHMRSLVAARTPCEEPGCREVRGLTGLHTAHRRTSCVTMDTRTNFD